MRVCVFVCVCVCVCVRACVRACERACVCVVSTFLLGECFPKTSIRRVLMDELN